VLIGKISLFYKPELTINKPVMHNNKNIGLNKVGRAVLLDFSDLEIKVQKSAPYSM